MKTKYRLLDSEIIPAVLTLETLSPTEMRRANRIAALGCLTVTVGNQIARVALHAARPALLSSLSIPLAVGSIQGRIHFASPLVPIYARALLAGGEFEAIAEKNRLMLLEGLLEPVLDGLEKALHETVSCLACDDGALEGSIGFTVWLLGSDEPSIFGVWAIPPPLIDSALDILSRVIPPVCSGYPDLPGVMRYVAGSISLPRADVESLEPGDILLGCPNESDGVVVLNRTYRVARCRRQEHTLTITEVFMSDAASLPASAQTDLLPVDISFELGSITMTYGEISSLRPGSVIELSHLTMPKVTILANGISVGCGEVVKIGDRLGVRVQTLRFAPAGTDRPCAVTSDSEGKQSSGGH